MSRMRGVVWCGFNSEVAQRNGCSLLGEVVVKLVVNCPRRHRRDCPDLDVGVVGAGPRVTRRARAGSEGSEGRCSLVPAATMQSRMTHGAPFVLPAPLSWSQSLLVIQLPLLPEVSVYVATGGQECPPRRESQGVARLRILKRTLNQCSTTLLGWSPLC